MWLRIPCTRLCRIFRTIAMGLWALSGLALLSCFLLYWMYGGILAFLLLTIAICLILYQAEDYLVYHPELPTHSRVFVPIPTMFGMPYENVHIRSGDGTLLHLFFVRQPEERARNCPTLIFLHGNAGNIGHRLQNIAGIYAALHVNILILEYRGYGLSEGVPSEEGLCMDARTAVDYLFSRSDINQSEIIVFGRSLGGAIAIDLASRPEYADRIWCLIVENTFTSIPDMAQVFLSYKLLHYLPLFCYKNKFMSIAKVPMLRIPVLFVSGLADTLVPPRMMSELHSRCGSEHKQIVQVPNGMHNDTWIVPGYYKYIATFLQNKFVIECKKGRQNVTSKMWQNVRHV